VRLLVERWHHSETLDRDAVEHRNGLKLLKRLVTVPAEHPSVARTRFPVDSIDPTYALGAAIRTDAAALGLRLDAARGEGEPQGLHIGREQIRVAIRVGLPAEHVCEPVCWIRPAERVADAHGQVGNGPEDLDGYCFMLGSHTETDRPDCHVHDRYTLSPSVKPKRGCSPYCSRRGTVMSRRRRTCARTTVRFDRSIFRGMFLSSHQQCQSGTGVSTVGAASERPALNTAR
jgi:hypothetical protein